MLAWADLEALGYPESGNGNLCMWTRSCGLRSDDSVLGPVAGGRKKGRLVQRVNKTGPRGWIHLKPQQLSGTDQPAVYKKALYTCEGHFDGLQ